MPHKLICHHLEKCILTYTQHTSVGIEIVLLYIRLYLWQQSIYLKEQGQKKGSCELDFLVDPVLLLSSKVVYISYKSHENKIA